jgi:hypothetical protein
VRGGQRRPDVDRIRSTRSRTPAASISFGPGDPGAGSDGARSVGGPTCSGRRRGSRRDSSRCGDRPRSCRRSRGLPRSYTSGSHAHKRSDRRRSFPRPASRLPLSIRRQAHGPGGATSWSFTRAERAGVSGSIGGLFAYAKRENIFCERDFGPEACPRERCTAVSRRSAASVRAGP